MLTFENRLGMQTQHASESPSTERWLNFCLRMWFTVFPFLYQNIFKKTSSHQCLDKAVNPQSIAGPTNSKTFLDKLGSQGLCPAAILCSFYFLR